jgi:hypothetical protein
MKYVFGLSLFLVFSCAQKANFSGQASVGNEADANSIAIDPNLDPGSAVDEASSGSRSDSAVDESSSGSSSGANGGNGNGSGTGSINDCVEGDRVVIAFAGPVKECIDSGKTWHFEAKTCVSMPKAAFNCDWETLQGKLAALNLLTETLKNDYANGAKLISCGQSSDGNRMAVQWIRPVSGVSCNKLQEGFGITTGCYTHYVDTLPPPPAQTEEERRARVSQCLSTL